MRARVGDARRPPPRASARAVPDATAFTERTGTGSTRPAQLRDLLREVRTNEMTSAVVSGNIDAIGFDSDNQALSEDRAASVVVALEKAEVTTALTSAGHGEPRPVAANEIDSEDNPAGRQLNRPSRSSSPSKPSSPPHSDHRQRANLPAARQLAAGIPHAEVQIIGDGGPELSISTVRLLAQDAPNEQQIEGIAEVSRTILTAAAPCLPRNRSVLTRARDAVQSGPVTSRLGGVRGRRSPRVPGR
ncbi:hypothetical protein ACNPNP_11085 [Microbacterium sp. AGC85]